MQTECEFICIYMRVFTCWCVCTHVCVVRVVCVRRPLREPLGTVHQYPEYPCNEFMEELLRLMLFV